MATLSPAFKKGADAPETLLSRVRAAPAWLRYGVLFAVLFYAVATRRWDALMAPQLYAEDGKVWYSEANARGGLQTLFLPHAGYFELLSRLAAWTTLGLPLTVAPLVFNVVALVMRVLPAAFVLTGRVRAVLPSVWARAALAALIVAMPGTGEVHGNLTNAHTHLSLLAAFVILLAQPDARRGWRIADVAIALLSGLSGPFCIPLAPVALLRWRLADSDERHHLRTLALVTTACAAVQVVALLFLDPAGRASKGTLGATPELFLHLLGGKVFCASLVGDATFFHSLHGRTNIAWNAVTAFFASAMGVFLIGRAAWKGPRALSLFLAFAGLMFVVALVFPLRLNVPVWDAMATGLHCGNRYFFIPIVGFFAALVWLAQSETDRSVRLVAIALLALAPVGALAEWTFDPWPNSGFARAAAKFDQAPAGTKMVIPAAPAPDWAFPVTKR